MGILAVQINDKRPRASDRTSDVTRGRICDHTCTVDQVRDELVVTSPQSDPVLAVLVAHAEQAGLRVPLTLFVGGTIISGILTSVIEWADEVEATFPTHEGEGMGIGEAIATGVKEAAEGAPAGTPYQVIHLKDVVFMGQPVVNGPPWRGRLTDVSGWMFGALGVG